MGGGTVLYNACQSVSQCLFYVVCQVSKYLGHNFLLKITDKLLKTNVLVPNLSGSLITVITLIYF